MGLTTLGAQPGSILRSKFAPLIKKFEVVIFYLILDSSNQPNFFSSIFNL